MGEVLLHLQAVECPTSLYSDIFDRPSTRIPCAGRVIGRAGPLSPLAIGPHHATAREALAAWRVWTDPGVAVCAMQV